MLQIHSVMYIVCALVLACGGCTANQRVPAIQCVILMDLKDASEVRDVCADAFTLTYAPVQQVITGPRLDAHQSGAEARFNVGINASFFTVEQLHQFLANEHVRAFMQRWQPRCHFMAVAAYGPTCEPEAPLEESDEP